MTPTVVIKIPGMIKQHLRSDSLSWVFLKAANDKLSVAIADSDILVLENRFKVALHNLVIEDAVDFLFPWHFPIHQLIGHDSDSPDIAGIRKKIAFEGLW